MQSSESSARRTDWLLSVHSIWRCHSQSCSRHQIWCGSLKDQGKGMKMKKDSVHACFWRRRCWSDRQRWVICRWCFAISLSPIAPWWLAFGSTEALWSSLNHDYRTASSNCFVCLFLFSMLHLLGIAPFTSWSWDSCSLKWSFLGCSLWSHNSCFCCNWCESLFLLVFVDFSFLFFCILVQYILSRIANQLITSFV